MGYFMRVSLLLAVLSLPTNSVSETRGVFLTAPELDERCRSDDALDNLQCAMVLNTVADTVTILELEGYLDRDKPADICIPSGVLGYQLQDQWESFTSRLKRLPPGAAVFVVLDAYRERWPCQEGGDAS